MTTTTHETSTTLTGDYDLDASHSRVGFAARHAMVTTVRGSFPTFTGSVHLDEADVSKSTAHLEIDATSVTTGNADRDAHLHSPDFFDVENFPTITFDGTAARQLDDDTFELTGDLTIKGVTKPVTIEFEKTGTNGDPWGNFRVGFEGKTKVNRKDWNLVWNVAIETGGILVSEKVTLEFDISAVKRQPQG